jgi:hypothetical protein
MHVCIICVCLNGRIHVGYEKLCATGAYLRILRTRRRASSSQIQLNQSCILIIVQLFFYVKLFAFKSVCVEWHVHTMSGDRAQPVVAAVDIKRVRRARLTQQQQQPFPSLSLARKGAPSCVKRDWTSVILCAVTLYNLAEQREACMHIADLVGWQPIG